VSTRHRGPRRHIVIPDGQVKQGVRTSHWGAIGRYIAEWQPEVIVNIGDFYDMPSLSKYEEDLIAAAARRVETDITAGDNAFKALCEPWRRIKGYKPTLIYTLGNHENRYARLLDEQPTLRGSMREPWGWARANGWAVFPYLKPVKIDGVSYCHLFVKGANGRVTNQKFGMPNARTQVLREMHSCTAGHKPGLDVHIQPVGSGSMRGIIAGSCYQHEEEYMTPQGTTYWRGILVKHEVHEGNYDLMEVSLKYLLRKYT